MNLKKLYTYKDGQLYWKIQKSNRIKKGDSAGSLCKNGYYYIGLNGMKYKRSRLIYFWHHGYMPENFIDHRNRISTDDRIENLREISSKCNTRNCGNHKDNKSGVKGVGWDSGKNNWRAYITNDQKQIFLGRYKSFSDAVCARLAGEQCLNWSGCDSYSPAYQYVKEIIK